MSRTLPVLLGALAVLAGCGPTAQARAAATEDPVDHHAHAAHVINSAPVRMWTLSGGDWVPFANGAEQTVGGMQVQVWLTPFPPGRKAVIHYQISRFRQPVGGAVLNLSYDHEVMDHGPFSVSATEAGPGHFEAPLEFIMSGYFWIDTRIRVDGVDSLLKLRVESER